MVVHQRRFPRLARCIPGPRAPCLAIPWVSGGQSPPCEGHSSSSVAACGTRYNRLPAPATAAGSTATRTPFFRGRRDSARGSRQPSCRPQASGADRGTRCSQADLCSPRNSDLRSSARRARPPQNCLRFLSSSGTRPGTGGSPILGGNRTVRGRRGQSGTSPGDGIAHRPNPVAGVRFAGLTIEKSDSVDRPARFMCSSPGPWQRSHPMA